MEGPPMQRREEARLRAYYSNAFVEPFLFLQCCRSPGFESKVLAEHLTAELLGGPNLFS